MRAASVDPTSTPEPLPVPAIATVTEPPAARSAAATSARVRRSIEPTEPFSTTARMSGTSSRPNPSARSRSAAVTAELPVATTIASRSWPTYQLPPTMPRSAWSLATRPISGRWSIAWSRSSGNVAITENGEPAPHDFTTRPPSFRTSAPVIPCCDGRPPVPIVVSVAAGSSGREPVSPASVAVPRLMSEWSDRQLRGSWRSSSVPTPFHATSRTSRGRSPSATPSTAFPARTSG